jgi:hypothetical protein
MTVMVRAFDFSKTVRFLGINICRLNLIVTVYLKLISVIIASIVGLITTRFKG